MRCLYCNKKLSLLKLAKGDSFCSAEHFDAHQLQLSKSAFERLLNVPSDPTQKAPLVMTPVAEVPPPLEVKPKQTKPPRKAEVPKKAITAKAPQKMLEPAEEAAVARLKAFASPPEAPFASSPPRPCPMPAHPVAIDLQAAMEERRELAYPVHEVEITACLLNLYLQLNVSHFEALDAHTAFLPVVAPEGFPGTAVMPALSLLPDFPQYKVEPEAEEEIAPVESAPVVAEPPAVVAAVEPSLPEPVELAAPIEVAPEPTVSAPPAVVSLAAEPVELAVPVKVAPEPELAPHVQSAAIAPAAPEVSSPMESTPLESVPLVARPPQLPVEPFVPLQAEIPKVAERIEVAPPVFAAPVAESAVVEPEPAVLAPLLPAEPATPLVDAAVAAARVPFLVAPSFKERRGNQPLFDSVALCVPNTWSLAAAFQSERPAQLASMPPAVETFRATETPLPLRDWKTSHVASGAEFSASPAFILPILERPETLGGWHAKGQTMGTVLTPHESARTATEVDFARPSAGSLPVRLGEKQPEETERASAFLSCAAVRLPLLPSCGDQETSFAPAQFAEAEGSAKIPPTGAVDGRVVRTGRLSLDVLKTKVSEQALVHRSFPAEAVLLSCPTILAPFPAWITFSKTAWKGRATHIALPAAVSTWAVLPVYPLQPLPQVPVCRKNGAGEAESPSLASRGPQAAAWLESDSIVPATASVGAAGVVPTLRFADASAVGGRVKIAAGTASPIARNYPFVAAESNVPSVAEERLRPATVLPGGSADDVDSNAHPNRVAPCAPLVTWQPKAAKSLEAPPLKLLPVRKGPILPTVQNWKRLGVPSR